MDEDRERTIALIWCEVGEEREELVKGSEWWLKRKVL